jgi:hypothetical protein
MNRNDKIKLLQDILAGRKPLNVLMPPVIRMWTQDEKNPDLFHCKLEGWTKRKDETLPQEITGRRIINIFVILNNIPSIAETESEVSC